VGQQTEELGYKTVPLSEKGAMYSTAYSIFTSCLKVPTPAKNVHTSEYLRDRNRGCFTPHETDCGRSAKFLILLYGRMIWSCFSTVAAISTKPLVSGAAHYSKPS
jgi:hypothetical protein